MGMEIVKEPETNNLLLKAIELTGSKIGNTPLIRFNRILRKPGIELYAKVEWKQLSGSVKARAAYGIIKDAVFKGLFNDGKSLLDATSGNTGIAYAAIGAATGIPVTLCLPENASKERIQILRKYGADIVFTSRFGGTDEAQETAQSLASRYSDKYVYVNQYRNDENWKAHYNGTAFEITRDLPDVTHFVAGLGTTGTFIGTGRGLKNAIPSIELIALQPDNALHGLEGWKHLETAIVPDIFDETLANKTIEISTEIAYETLLLALRTEGILLSPSAAANLAGAIKLAEKIDHGKIVTILPDNAEKYSEVIKRIL